MRVKPRKSSPIKRPCGNRWDSQISDLPTFLQGKGPSERNVRHLSFRRPCHPTRISRPYDQPGTNIDHQNASTATSNPTPVPLSELRQKRVSKIPKIPTKPLRRLQTEISISLGLGVRHTTSTVLYQQHVQRCYLRYYWM